MNTLDILLKHFNWQGGTIHDALKHFQTIDKTMQDNICNELTNNLSKITDLSNTLLCMKIRNNYLTIELYAEHNLLTVDQAQNLMVLAKDVFHTDIEEVL